MRRAARRTSGDGASPRSQGPRPRALIDAAGVAALPEARQSISTPIGQRIEQHCLHDAEDDGGRANPEGQDQDDEGGEAGVPPKSSQAISQFVGSHHRSGTSSRTRGAAAGLAGDRAAAADGGEPLVQVAEAAARRGAIGLSGRCLGAGREALAVVLDGEVEAAGVLRPAAATRSAPSHV